MNDLPSRLTSALANRYRLERPLGEGGMATVYLAQDLRHNRQVAIKVLKPELAAVVGAERFLAEIETTANLQHPHILPLFDSGEADDFLFYVMPYIDGETLADRIAREKQLPVDEALGIATSVCNALQVAHDAGVVHRDIKPGNILLSRGEPLVADFGIALAVGAGGARLTETGLSVGTPYYMSPEQATGDQAIGPAADIYALACVLFEMLVGEPPYRGNSAQAVLGKIIQGLPVSATAARKTVPTNVDAAIRKALEKLPADRFTRAADFGAALSDPAFRHGADGHAAVAADTKRWKTVALSATVVAILAVGAAVSGTFRSQGADSRVLRQNVNVSSQGALYRWGRDVAIAPDGSGIAYPDRVADGQPVQLFYKARGEAEGTPLPGTEDYNGVAFSPDGQSVLFMRNGSLITRPVRGGAATTLANGVDLGTPGLDWLDDGSILYEARPTRLLRMWLDGSAPADTLLEVTGMRWAQAIGGSGTALVNSCPGCDLGILDLETSEVTWILKDATRGWYVPTGHIVWVRNDGSVFAQPYDPETREVGAVGTPLFEGVRTALGWADMVLADDGTMIYVREASIGSGGNEHLVWVDRAGNAERVDPEWPDMELDHARRSPDGARVVLTIFGSEGGADLWVHELPSGPRTRLTSGDGRYLNAVWSADSRSLIFQAEWAGGRNALLRLRADGSSPEPEVLLEREGWNVAWPELTPGDAGIVFARGGVGGSSDLVHYDFASDSVTSLLATGATEVAPTVSPDGRWLAYTSNVTGDWEVFVGPFPDVGASRTQISNGGGIEPLWSPDGDELFYRGEEGLVSVRFRPDTTFVVTSRTPLFDLGPGYLVRPRGRAYDVDASGERFLFTENASPTETEEASTEADIILVQNWFEELRQRLGESRR